MVTNKLNKSFDRDIGISTFKINFLFLSFFFFFFLFRVAPVAYGGSQARGLIRATATGLHHSHGNVGSKLSV